MLGEKKTNIVLHKSKKKHKHKRAILFKNKKIYFFCSLCYFREREIERDSREREHNYVNLLLVFLMIKFVINPFFLFLIN